MINRLLYISCGVIGAACIIVGCECPLHQHKGNRWTATAGCACLPGHGELGSRASSSERNCGGAFSAGAVSIRSFRLPTAHHYESELQ
jgi:hypothetical protein